MPVYVVGAGGMVGKSILDSSALYKPLRERVPWEDKYESINVLNKFCTQLTLDESISIVWAAGAGVVGSTVESLADELEVFEAFIHSLVKSGCNLSTFTLISSAGGIYSGNKETLISEETEAKPTSPYGVAKFRQETLLTKLGLEHNFKVVIARLSNVYGPNQNMNKRQGLISNLIRATFSREPLPIFVPIDTRRDYINSNDVGLRVVKLIEIAENSDEKIIVKIICAGNTHTISEIIGEIKAVSKRKPPIIFSLSPLAAQHPKSLAFESKVHREIDASTQVLLPTGIKQICDTAIMSKLG